MKKPLLVGLGGTLRQRSYSRAALQAALRLAEARGTQIELLDLRELDLPMYVPDLPIEGYPERHRPAITRLLEACRNADAMLWASPTYHGTLSGVLKNALDFVELLSEDTPSYLSGRAVGLIAVSESETFSAMANAAHELRMWLAPTYVTLDRKDFNTDLTLKQRRPDSRVERLVGELMEFAEWRRYKTEQAQSVRELRVALTTNDFERAVHLYQSGLGLEVVQQWASPQGRGVVLSAGRATLEIVDHAQAELIDQVEAGARVTGPVRLAFEVADLDSTAASTQTHGAAAVNEAVVTPWGDRNQRLRDPEGMQLTLFQLRTQ